MVTSVKKANSVVTQAVDAATGVVTFKVLGAGEFGFNPASASEVVRSRAMLHGFVQRIADAAAMSRDTKTGAAPSPLARLAAMKRIADHYATGSVEWSIPRAPRVDTLDSVILAAVVEATGKTEAEVLAMVERGAAGKGMTTKAYLAGLATAALVAPIVARIRATEARGVDGDGLLAGMMSEGEREDEETDEEVEAGVDDQGPGIEPA